MIMTFREYTKLGRVANTSWHRKRPKD